MNKTSLVVSIYILGIIFGAFFLDIWSADISPEKAIYGLIWTAIFLIALFFVDRNN
jgi:hypothetical protein|tara:strand:+ start:801 stop:968 length:168 start_codon:yes stop_codon:yes gene_type:complete